MLRPQVAIIDYGMGNVLSVARAFEYCGADVSCTRNVQEIFSATHIILPGVGAFKSAMQALEEYNLIDVIPKVVEEGKPFMGICLGMQLLFSESEEFGSTRGLNIMQGEVVSIPAISNDGTRLRVPHIGWASLNAEDSLTSFGSGLLPEISKFDSVYFAHSFQVKPTHKETIKATYSYGDNSIVAVVEKNNVLGCQFHPEKSGKVGLKIVAHFLEKGAL